MSKTDCDAASIDCLFETILCFMLPFFIVGAGGNADIARAAVGDLIDAYSAGTPAELDLVGRIVGFSIAALDNLRLSMTADMSDTKVLRYRSNAVTLSRASDQSRMILEAVQAKQEPTRQLPRPAVAPAPAAPARREAAPVGIEVAAAVSRQPEAPSAPVRAVPAAARGEAAPARIEVAAVSRQPETPSAPVRAVPAAHPQRTMQNSASPHFVASAASLGVREVPPPDIEALKRDARVMLGAFSRHGAQSSVSMPVIPDPATIIGAAVREAVGSARRAPAA